MNREEKIHKIQSVLHAQGIDGWLLYDFHGSNKFVHELLEIPADIVLTRRFFYWIPEKGEPIKILHRIEAESVNFLPGENRLYTSWTELEKVVAKVLKKSKKVAMEYSPRNMNPYISMVDAGTVEMVRELDIDVVSSEDLLQFFISTLDDEQIASHLEAARVLTETVGRAWDLIAERLHANKKITEYDVQQFILSEFLGKNFITEDGPICAVNGHSALPHYMAQKDSAKEITRGDFILIDLWCKKNVQRSIYADITRVAIAAPEPTPRQEEIFQIVKGSMLKGIDLIQSRMEAKAPLKGCEVDDVCRRYIQSKGYGDHFSHRTGHNIGTSVHGAGAHLDNFETSDQRHILPSTCFSLEPGIYLPGEFGIRLECDILIRPGFTVEITGGLQESIVCLLS